MNSWKIYAEEIFLVDIGTSSFTGYEVDKGGFKAADIASLYDTYPGLLDGTLKNHHIHTHHSMTTFFSTTDWENLHDRGEISNYFMMLIVNFAGTYTAKVAFPVKRKEVEAPVLELINNADGFPAIPLKVAKEDPYLAVMDMKIVHERAVPTIEEAFETRYKHILTALEEERKASSKVKHLGANQSLGNPRIVDEWDYDFRGKRKQKGKKDKKISEMTDREFQDFDKGTKSERFSMDDVRAAVNMAVTSEFTRDIRTLPLTAIRKANSLKGKKREEFVESFGENIDRYLSTVTDVKTADEQALLLVQMGEYIESYCDPSDMVNELLEEIMEQLSYLHLVAGAKSQFSVI
jgi:hypothetical protein